MFNEHFHTKSICLLLVLDKMFGPARSAAMCNTMLQSIVEGSKEFRSDDLIFVSIPVHICVLLSIFYIHPSMTTGVIEFGHETTWGHVLVLHV